MFSARPPRWAWAAIYVREDIGGSGLSRLDAALIFEALARGCPTVAAYLSIHNMATWMIDRFGDDAQREKWGPGLCRMDLFASYCLTEPGAGSDAAAIRMKARPRRRSLCARMASSSSSPAPARPTSMWSWRAPADEGARGMTAFVVEKDAPGLSFGANERKMGWNAQPTRQVICEDCRMSRRQPARRGGRGVSRSPWPGSTAGGSTSPPVRSAARQAALDKALAYMRRAQAFGKRLDEFQALQFRLADMATELEAARTLLWRAASALDAKAPDATALCAMAKRFATDAGFNVANDALQLLGGYGYLADYGVEKIVRDLRVHQILEGTNEIMRLIVARELIGRD